MKRLLTGMLIALGIGLGLGLGLAAPLAHADANTDNYVYLLRVYGFTGSASSMIEAGHEVCSQLAAGYTPAAVMVHIVQAADGKILLRDAEFLVGSAIPAFCPQYGNVLLPGAEKFLS